MAINKTKAHTLITDYMTFQAITKTVDDKSCDVVKNIAKEIWTQGYTAYPIWFDFQMGWLDFLLCSTAQKLYE